MENLEVTRFIKETDKIAQENFFFFYDLNLLFITPRMAFTKLTKKMKKEIKRYDTPKLYKKEV